MRKVFVVVERRADYSRFRPVLMEMRNDPFFEIHLVVTGICLLDRHGLDIQHIRQDGFHIDAELPMFRSTDADNGAEMVRSMARVLGGLANELERARPDVVLSGFDIGANFAVTVAAAHMKIPVAHIQGGEVTGSIDESIRHAMSKFAHLHFPATEASRERLIKMGERPEHIFVVGCPSIDVIMQTPVIQRTEIEKEFGLDFSRPAVLMIQHPVTTEDTDSFRQISETVEAIAALDIQAVVLLPNNDAGHKRIIEKVTTCGLKWYPSLPTETFVNLYRNMWALVGNSSSGIHETPSLHIPAVNIGTRQQGRERAANVIDVGYDRTQIQKGLEKALFDREFRSMAAAVKNPYGDGTSAKRIVHILKTVSFDGLIQKRFHDEGSRE